jgi:aminoglycoside phosphotransferase (APT) family kinase protein
MPSPDAGLLRWAVQAAAPGAEVAAVRGLRGGDAPWLLRLRRGDADHAVVLRVGEARAPLATEAAALRLAAEHGLPAPRLLAADLNRDPPAMLVEAVEGASTIPPERPPARLRALGRAAAALAAVLLIPGQALPRRDRPIASVDFVALRRRPPARPLLLEAEARLAAAPPSREPEGFVHGDLWQGNALWAGDTLAALVDWDCAGVGPPGIDLGSLRCDAAVCFGAEAAADVLAGWEEAAGRPAAEVARWDVVAALSTPPDMGWFPDAIAGQGRPDLGPEVLLARRDAFLGDALDRLDGGG